MKVVPPPRRTRRHRQLHALRRCSFHSRCSHSAPQNGDAAMQCGTHEAGLRGCEPSASFIAECAACVGVPARGARPMEVSLHCVHRLRFNVTAALDGAPLPPRPHDPTHKHSAAHVGRTLLSRRSLGGLGTIAGAGHRLGRGNRPRCSSSTDITPLAVYRSPVVRGRSPSRTSAPRRLPSGKVQRSPSVMLLV
jgi:hypothetical protein